MKPTRPILSHIRTKQRIFSRGESSLVANNPLLSITQARTHRVGEVELVRAVPPGVQRASAPVRPADAQADRRGATVLSHHHHGLREAANEGDLVVRAVDTVSAGDLHGADVGGLGIERDVLVEGDGSDVSGDGQEETCVHGWSVGGSLDLYITYVMHNISK